MNTFSSYWGPECVFARSCGSSKIKGTRKYMLFAGWEVRIVKNCDRSLENAARGRRPRAAFSSPRSQFFTIRTDPKPANNLFIFSCNKLAYNYVCETGLCIVLTG